ncbi:MAG: hypothetical protein KGL39_14135 [Patescibacteria group bacterium]|nr:hypothetical protein [Patescibacteria group bacterium]
MINKFWMLLLFGLISAIVYFSVEGIDQRAARIAACAPLIYFGAICLEAAFQNGMLLAGLGQFSLAKLL